MFAKRFALNTIIRTAAGTATAALVVVVASTSMAPATLTAKSEPHAAASPAARSSAIAAAVVSTPVAPLSLSNAPTAPPKPTPVPTSVPAPKPESVVAELSQIESAWMQIVSRSHDAASSKAIVELTRAADCLQADDAVLGSGNLREAVSTLSQGSPAQVTGEMSSMNQAMTQIVAKSGSPSTVHQLQLLAIAGQDLQAGDLTLGAGTINEVLQSIS